MSTPTNQKIGLDNKDGNMFNKVLFRYLPYWPLFILLLLMSIACAWLYLRYTIPIYEATATILIKDEKKGGMDDSELMESLNLFGSKKIVENEIEIIKSRSLMSDVVRKLYLYAPVTQEGNIVSKSAYTISPIKIETQNPDSLKETRKVYFTFNPTNGQVKINDKSYPINTWVDTDYGTMRFLPNPGSVNNPQQSPLFFSLLSVKKVASSLINRLQLSPASKQSTVIYLRFRDPIPERAEDILDQLITSYNIAAINDKNVLAANTLAFVEDRLHSVVGELDSVETRIQQYKTNKGIVDISEQGKQFLTTVGANDEKISELNVQLAVLDQVEQYVNNQGSKERIVPATLGIADPILSELLSKLYDAEIQYDRLKKTTAENNPILTSLADEISKIKPNILQNIQNQRRNLEVSKQNLTKTSNQYSSMLRTIPQKERELLEISRQQSIKNNIYTFLLQKREETYLSYASTVADSRLVDNAYSTMRPVVPKVPMIYLSAIIIAMMLGIGLITLREVLNRKILFRNEIESYTSYPIIGEIMYDNSKNPIVISDGVRNFIAEQFRQLRTSLTYLGINTRKKKILVTSTLSGEGKSFITANLGISLALTGKKVVVIELDLRKPKLSEIFNVSREVGVSSYFIGDKEPDEIIKSTAINENLFIIPSGPIPPNPSELILNGKIQELLAYLDSIFDYILIDTAPVSPVTDAYILSPLCDTTLYVIRHGYTPKTYVQMLDENNKVRSLKNLAIIFNGVRNRGIGKYDYGYGYGYGNGYGYGYAEDKKKKKIFA